MINGHMEMKNGASFMTKEYMEMKNGASFMAKEYSEMKNGASLFTNGGSVPQLPWPRCLSA